MAQKKGPTEQHLKAALQFVAENELTTAKLAPALTSKVGKRVAALPEPWPSLVEAEVLTNAATLATQLRAKAPTMATEGAKEMMNGYVYPYLMVTDADVVQLVTQNAAASDFAASQAGEHYAYLLKDFVKVTPAWKSCSKNLADAQGTTEELVAKAEQLDAFAKLTLKTMLNAGKSAPNTITATRQQLVAVGKDPLFGQCTAPLLAELSAWVDEIEKRLSGCTEEEFVKRVVLLKNQALSTLTEDSVRSICAPVTQLCTLCELDAKSVSAWMADGRLNSLRPAFTKSHHPANFQKLLGAYGFQGYAAVCLLDGPAKKAKAIDLWLDIESEFVKQVPTGSSSGLIITFLEIACAETTVKDSIIKIMQGSSTRIQVAKDVTTFGWQLIEGIRVPRAFSKGAVSTDEACIKHVAEEVGPKPTVDKLGAYFAEMVLACVEAGKLFNKDGQIPMSAYTIPCKIGTWNIMIGTKGQKKIFHIDSGYENSNWRKA